MGFLGIGGSTTGAVVSGVTSFASDYYENRDFTSAVINGAVSAGISLIWSAVDNIILKGMAGMVGSETAFGVCYTKLCKEEVRLMMM